VRCVKCGNDVKKKDRVAAGGRCPNCKHQFVTIPEMDGITDMVLANAEKVVSGNGTYHFLAKQLEYQLYRTFLKKQRSSGSTVSFTLVFVVVSLILSVAATPVFLVLTLIGVITVIVTLVKSSSYDTTLVRLHTVVQKWTDTNPHPKLIKNKKYEFNSDNSHLEEVSFDRVLVCDSNDTVNFFLENLFHFHYSCPVLGGNGYPEAICGDMLRRLKSNTNLKVFLLHDYSPQGSAFVRKMRTDPNWFGDRQYQIVDLGLNFDQKDKLFKFMTRGNNETAEVTLFTPATLIMLCGAAINEEVALDQVHLVADQSGGGDGGSGGYG
jgi:hypothetical protein